MSHEDLFSVSGFQEFWLDKKRDDRHDEKNAHDPDEVNQRDGKTVYLRRLWLKSPCSRYPPARLQKAPSPALRQKNVARYRLRQNPMTRNDQRGLKSAGTMQTERTS